MASSSWFFVCSLEKISQPPHCFLVRAPERDRLPRSAVSAAIPRSPLHQPGRDGERLSVRLGGQARERDRLPESRRGVEHRLGGVHRAHQPRAAARDDDARWKQLVETRLPHFLARHLEDFEHARSDDLGQEPPRKRLDAVATDLPDLHLLSVVDDVRQGVAVVELQTLGLVERRPQTDRDVARDVVATDGKDGEVPGRAVVVHDHVVVPAPISTTHTPSSISCCVSTPSPAASPAQTTSSTSKPAPCTHLITFWTAVWAPVMMFVSTSSRWPVMPTASRTPSWPSTV